MALLLIAITEMNIAFAEVVLYLDVGTVPLLPQLLCELQGSFCSCICCQIGSQPKVDVPTAPASTAAAMARWCAGSTLGGALAGLPGE